MRLNIQRKQRRNQALEGEELMLSDMNFKFDVIKACEAIVELRELYIFFRRK
jgi:hypothetical protein